MGRLTGKGAIVTGGAAAVRDAGGEAAYRHADVGTLAEVEAMVAFAVDTYGGLDVIHNNAYWTGGGYVGELDPEIWERSLRIMLTGVFYGMRAAIPRMLARGGGSIINTSSVEGLYGGILGSPYNTAKGGMINLTRSVALEYGRKNIRANCNCTGAVVTPALEQLASFGGRSLDDVALFLASDESSAITGAAIVADGGLTSGLNVGGFPPYGG